MDCSSSQHADDAKLLVEEQIKIINSSLVIDDEVRDICLKHGISMSQVRSILFRTNLQIKRHNRAKYGADFVDQLVQKVLQDRNVSDDQIASPIVQLRFLLNADDTSIAHEELIPRKARLVNEVASNLPEGQLLFELDVCSADQFELDRKDALAERSDIEDLQALKIPLSRLSSAGDDSKILESAFASQQERMDMYNRLRDEYIKQTDEINYAVQKLAYFEKLANILSFLDDVQKTTDGEEQEWSELDFTAEIRRLAILVEKLRFALSD